MRDRHRLGLVFPSRTFECPGLVGGRGVEGRGRYCRTLERVTVEGEPLYRPLGEYHFVSLWGGGALCRGGGLLQRVTVSPGRDNCGA